MREKYNFPQHIIREAVRIMEKHRAHLDPLPKLERLLADNGISRKHAMQLYAKWEHMSFEEEEFYTMY